MRYVNMAIGAVIAAATIGLWALANRPSPEPLWPNCVAGMSFSPYRIDDDPFQEQLPTPEEIDSDLVMLSGKVRSLRTYSVKGSLGQIPKLARARGLKVTVGAWIGADLTENEVELARLIEIVRANPNVDRVIVGNEVLLRGELDVDQLSAYIDRVRTAVRVPVSTAEPWHVWLKYPELARYCSFIGAHMLPYWEGIDLDGAVGHVVANYDLLRKTFPDLPILIAEVGWPSNGRTRRSAVASEANEAIFLRRFLSRAENEKYDYFLMEAFDQPWKRDTEGSVGAYWGIYDVTRNPKFAFKEPIVGVPEWQGLAGATVVIAVLSLGILLKDGRLLRRRGRGFLAVIAHVVATTMVWIAYQYSNQYLTTLTVTVGLVLAVSFLGVTVVLLTEAHEMAEASWVTCRRRLFGPARPPADGKDPRLPKVSIHVPAYNEPPEMVIGTLNSLAQLDYQDFEVLVIDNNTKDPAVWRPVEAHCGQLGDRFRFFHVDQLKGFKAGALNFALAHTAADAEIIAVIDSDYQVSPGWLRDLAPHFSRPEIGFVQAPQDYRDGNENAFKAMCYAEYEGFFHIGMVTRNDRNAIIEHGTMTMIRASALREVGGWAEWCITEDAELGLRILERGYEGAYVEKSYGKGLMPDTFIDYKKQRFRWAYGAIRILRRHSKELLRPAGNRLTRGQRYHFLAGWLPWLADGINLFFTVGALLWSAAIIADPQHVDPPMVAFTIPPLALFVFKIAKLAYLYRFRIGATRSQTVSAAIAGLALSHTVAKAVVSGLFNGDRPFFRTPKCKNGPALVQAFADAAEESVLAGALLFAGSGVALVQGRDFPGSLIWSAALFAQSLPYVAALIMSLTNALPSRRVASQAPALAVSPHA